MQGTENENAAGIRRILGSLHFIPVSVDNVESAYSSGGWGVGSLAYSFQIIVRIADSSL